MYSKQKKDKLAIFFECSNLELLENTESRYDPKSLLISNFAELQKLLNTIKNGSKYKNLFFNVKNLFNILYNAKENIEVKFEDCQQSLSEYFYLDKLINLNKNVLHFSYNFYLIQKISKENKECDKPLKKLIISKIILDFINYYGQLDNENDNDYENEIKNIEKENEEIIENNINYLINKIELKIKSDELKKMEIDDLYVEIIYALIIKKNFQNHSFFSEIYKQMDLDSIDISKKLYEKYLKKLFEDNNYINYYMVDNINQLQCPITINYFYFLFKYILKDSLYIYQIPFLNNIRQKILKLLKNNYNFITKENEFVIKKFLDIDYYTNEYIKKDIDLNFMDLIDNFNENYQALSTCMTSNKEKDTLEKKEENKSKKKKSRVKSLAVVKNNRHLLSNCSLDISKKIKSKKYNLNYLEEIFADKIFLGEANKNPQKIIFSEKTNFGFKINENVVAYSYNSYFKDQKDILIIYDKSSGKKNYIKGCSFPIGTKSMALMHNKILMGPCKKDGKNGIFLLYFENMGHFDLNFVKICNNFKATSICPLLKGGVKETDYFLIAGINIEKKIRIKLAKIFYYETNSIGIEIMNDNIKAIKDGNILIFQKPIYWIKQSKENGHIFVYSNKKIYHFSPLNIDNHLRNDEDEKLEKIFSGLGVNDKNSFSEEIEKSNKNSSFYEEIENNF